MKITIIYDNETFKEGLQSDWGFSCLIEAYGKNILFDTGARSDILLSNMKKLDLDPRKIDEVFISHGHWDHTGGLSDFLRINPVKIYVPASFPINPSRGEKVIKIKGSLKIHEHIFSTGELRGIEQSLVVKAEEGVVVIAGCSHPGVKEILEHAARVGRVRVLIGGLHGFRKFRLIEGLDWICPTHCTQHKAEIKALYPDKYVEGGAGRVLASPFLPRITTKDPSP
ncbi:MAG TPA: MBL fold metallo-hydrolase [Desulfobacteraceae bacterium]|nr:MBL fold metallo-hydrolase [Desulfobacteraceae bacterium]